MIRLTESEVRQVVALCRQGYGWRNVARRLGKPEETIRDIFRGRTWRSVTGGRLTPQGKRPGKQLAIYR